MTRFSFEGGEMFPADMYCLYPFDADLYQCSRGLQSERGSLDLCCGVTLIHLARHLQFLS